MLRGLRESCRASNARSGLLPDGERDGRGEGLRQLIARASHERASSERAPQRLPGAVHGLDVCAIVGLGGFDARAGAGGRGIV